MERKTIDLWGGKLTTAYLRGGKGSPLIFLSGPSVITTKDPLLLALSERFDVVAPIHPGFENPEDLDDIRNIHDLALYYDDLLGALGLDAAQIMGHSFGGMVAAEVAAHVPSRVSKLVLAAPVGLWNDAYPVADIFAVPIQTVQNLLWADPSSPAASAVTQAAAADIEGAQNPMLEMLIGLMKGFTSAGKFMWPIPDKGLARRLHRITAPTLLIWGSEDKVLPTKYGDDFVAGIHEAKLEVLDGAGHMVVYEKQDDVVKRVEEFLS